MYIFIPYSHSKKGSAQFYVCIESVTLITWLAVGAGPQPIDGTVTVGLQIMVRSVQG